MRGPYGFEPNESCQSCSSRADGFFCQLSASALEDFNAVKSSATYPAGALLFLEKQDPRGVFVLCGGEVKLSISSSAGKTLILRIAKAGEILDSWQRCLAFRTRSLPKPCTRARWRSFAVTNSCVFLASTPKRIKAQ